jgi:hypothetical protein
MSWKVWRATKTTAAWNGDVPPKGSESTFVSSGTFIVVSVWRPGPNVSSALPSRKKTADWFSCTMSCAPILMSADPCGGTRATICCPVWSKNCMTSIAICSP